MATQSPLTELHRANGADLLEEDDWLLPLNFGDSVQEYQTVRSQVGLMDLFQRSLLQFTGTDRVSYLQGMVSNDVKALTPGEGIQATVLDVNGKIQADVRILCTDEFFLMDLWTTLKERIITHLNRYLIADDVEISDLSDKYGLLSLQGPKARHTLEEILSPDQIPSKELGHITFRIGAHEVRIIRSTHTGEEGFDLMIPLQVLEATALQIQEAGKKFSLQWIGTEAQELLRVEAGIPRYGVDMSEENILLEAGLEQAVSFEKGCYLGQEVIERIRSRGHVNKKLVGLLLQGDIAADRDDKIQANGKEIGRVTSSILSPAFKRPLALGYVHRDYTSPGTKVFIDHSGTKIKAEISPLPFYKVSL